MVRQIALGNRRGLSLAALVDDEDFDRLSQYRWHWNPSWNGKGYAVRFVPAAGSYPSGHPRQTKIWMHRLIGDAPPHQRVDHINGNTLDNRRSNLRPATNSQNLQNLQHARSDSKTGIRGVQRIPYGRYRAVVTVLGRKIHLGCFRTLADAEAAVKEGRRRLMTHAPECLEITQP